MEVLVQESGRKNEFIRTITAFYTALEFIKNEYEILLYQVPFFLFKLKQKNRHWHR